MVRSAASISDEFRPHGAIAGRAVYACGLEHPLLLLVSREEYVYRRSLPTARHKAGAP
jgi:hypothetical protein